MKNTAKALYCTFLLLVTGCFFGDNVVYEFVSLSFPVSAQNTNMHLSADHSEVQEALKLIDNVLVANQIFRETKTLSPEEKACGIIALYDKCGITLISNKLDIGFTEENTSRLSAPVRKAIGELENKLKMYYGTNSVTVRN